jgi:hypothetical protein
MRRDSADVAGGSLDDGFPADRRTRALLLRIVNVRVAAVGDAGERPAERHRRKDGDEQEVSQSHAHRAMP